MEKCLSHKFQFFWLSPHYIKGDADTGAASLHAIKRCDMTCALLAMCKFFIIGPKKCEMAELNGGRL